MLHTEVLYKWQSKRTDKDRWLTFILTLIFMLLIYVAMKSTMMPSQSYQKKINTNYDILIEKYRPKRVLVIPAPTAPLANSGSSRISVEVKPAPGTSENTTDLLADVENLFAPETEQVLQPKKTGLVSPHQSDIQLVSTSNSKLDLFTSMGSPDFQPMHLSKRTPQIQDGSTSLTTMQSGGRSNVYIPTTDFTGGGFDKPIPTKDKASTDQSTVTQIQMIKLPDDFKSQMPKIFVNISQWMKQNPRPFPDAVKKFMAFRTNDLTSKVDFKINNRFFEIFLLCVESTYEIRICLIEENRTTLLIDEGFKHESHFLRTGLVYRMGNKEILSFGTKQEAASKNETQEFYQIFLSWWKTTGMDKL